MAKTPRYKFKLPRKLYGRNISSIRAELDTLQPLSVQSDGRVWREPIQTSYGCACFHFSDESDNLNLVQFVLSSIQLEVGYGSGSISSTIKELEKSLELMKKIGELEKKYDLSLDYDYSNFTEDEDEKKRLTIYLNDFDYNPDETLADLEARIDTLLEPLKQALEAKPRMDVLLRP